MIEAREFAANTGQDPTWPFGLKIQNASATLRRLADELDAGTVLLTEVKVTGLAKPDDFTTKVLSLVMVEAEKAAVP